MMREMVFGATLKFNDASIYNGSELKEGLESPNNIFNLPEEKSLPGDDVPVPYYIVGDNAFGINKRLMNPFISPCPWDDILVLVLQVHQIVVGGWISQSDEIVKDHTSCDDFSACLWPHGEMTKYFWMFTMRGQGTLEPRRGGKLEDTWATTLPQRPFRCQPEYQRHSPLHAWLWRVCN
jgi:hypothetical protein